MNESIPPIRSIIKGTGGCLPASVITNDDLARRMDTSHEWIWRRTGICQRHKAPSPHYTAHMAIQAAQEALKNADLAPEHLHFILLATSTPDHVFPPTAIQVQHALKAHGAVAFDINVACSGFLFALIMADSYLRNHEKNHALVIGAETMSRLVDWNDRSTAVLFGDGAGAVVLSAQPSQERGFISYHWESSGENYFSLYVCHGSEAPHGQSKILMNGREVFRHAVQKLEKSARHLLEQTHTPLEKVDWLVPHQANKRIIEALAEKLGFDQEKVIYTGDRHANTSAASIPLALWDAYAKNKIKKGDLLLIQAFGAGFAWGSCLIRA